MAEKLTPERSELRHNLIEADRNYRPLRDIADFHAEDLENWVEKQAKLSTNECVKILIVCLAIASCRPLEPFLSILGMARLAIDRQVTLRDILDRRWPTWEFKDE
jgi:hypothetical protein